MNTNTMQKILAIIVLLAWGVGLFMSNGSLKALCWAFPVGVVAGNAILVLLGKRELV